MQSLSLPPRTTAQIIARVAEAVIEAANLMPQYISEHPDFQEIGSRMLSIWENGVDGLAKSARL